MANPETIKKYSADGAVGQFLIVAPGSAEGQVKVAAAVTDKLVGVSSFLGADDGAPCDVIHDGIADTLCGGDVAAGEPLTSDDTGKAVTLAPAPGVNNRRVGFALAAGGAGDVIPVLVKVGAVQG